jgi:hypothetical protein
MTMKKSIVIDPKPVAKFLGVTIFCPTLNKEVTVSDQSISAHESECEMCGSHGEINMFIRKCECGKSHDIQISSW